MSAKLKALHAIQALPDNAAPQDVLNLLMKIYAIRSGLLRRAEAPQAPLWGCLRGSLHLSDDVDLTAPASGEPFCAAQGLLHR